MRIYVISLVDSEGYKDGKESLVKLFTDKDSAVLYGYEAYVNAYNDYCFGDEGDANGDTLKSKESFEEELVKDGYVCIMSYDSHCQIEYSVKELLID